MRDVAPLMCPKPPDLLSNAALFLAYAGNAAAAPAARKETGGNGGTVTQSTVLCAVFFYSLFVYYCHCLFYSVFFFSMSGANASWKRPFQFFFSPLFEIVVFLILTAYLTSFLNTTIYALISLLFFFLPM